MTVMTLYRLTSASNTKSNCGNIENNNVTRAASIQLRQWPGKSSCHLLLRRKYLAANHSSYRMAELNKYETKQRMLVGIKIKKIAKETHLSDKEMFSSIMSLNYIHKTPGWCLHSYHLSIECWAAPRPSLSSSCPCHHQVFLHSRRGYPLFTKQCVSLLCHILQPLEKLLHVSVHAYVLVLHYKPKQSSQ